MDKRWRRGLVGAVLLVAVVAGAAVWPAQLGGPTTYVTTHGSSMEPSFRQGDLALIRRQALYAVGDVVAYRSPTLKGTVVLHRIVGGTSTGYTFKGDNNGFTDPDQLPASALIGKLWIHVPKAGGLLGALRVVLPLLLGGLVLLGTGATVHRDRRRRRPAHLAPRPVQPASARWWRSATMTFAGVASVCLVLGSFAFGRPTSVPGQESVPYTQRGTFTYEGTAPEGPVYADGRVRTGDPIFRLLVNELDVTFDYAVTSPALPTLAGTIGIRTELSSTTGWKRVVDEVAPVTFTGTTARATIHLDLGRYDSLLNKVTAATGIDTGNATLTVLPDAEVVGTLGSERVEQGFAPKLQFALDPLQLKLLDAEEQLATRSASSLLQSAARPGRFVAFGLSVPVVAVRLASLLLGLPALIGVVAGIVALRRRLQDESDRIELRHGHRIVPVATERTPDVVEVMSMSDLARLAEQHQSLILHEQGEHGHEYVLQADGVRYRYRAREARPASRLG